MEGLPYDLFTDDPRAFQTAVQEVITRAGTTLRQSSINHRQWHLALLRSGQGRVQTVAVDREFGKLVVIEHDYGFVTRYAHLSQIDVVRGQQVDRGDTIGRMGSTGRSTGSHHYYEVWCNGNVLNPMDYILDAM